MKGFNHGHPISEETRRKMSESARRTLNGFKRGHSDFTKPRTLEFKAKMRVIALADKRKPDFTGHRHTEDSKKKMSIASHENNARYWLGKDRSSMFDEKYRRNMSEAMKKLVASGKHNFWKGGVTVTNKLARTRLDYHIWRKKVFERDDYRCFDCGKRGERLEAHHIYPFSVYIRLRYEIENGITLCKECHKNTATYGRKALQNGANPNPQPALASIGGSGTI